jgi:hypothetical protein
MFEPDRILLLTSAPIGLTVFVPLHCAIALILSRWSASA